MNQNRLHEIESHCTQESPPRCRAACPFGLDVRAFMARMAEGRPGEARRLLELHLPLPGIMARICDHPCENVCLRRDLGGSVALHGLELACMLAAGPQGRTLPLPPKRLRMAVLGAGLAGLAAAWDLARKAYPVTVFHRGAPLDALLTRYPQLQPTEGIAKDFAAEDMAALAARNVVFEPSEAEAALLERASEEYDAVLLDADAFPELAPET
ncbi:MAG: NAD(P)-binding protein, partial [Desulfovibrio sp.]|nr:NAD(P)-binding protein [Desulfovibrio sp.]